VLVCFCGTIKRAAARRALSQFSSRRLLVAFQRVFCRCRLSDAVGGEGRIRRCNRVGRCARSRLCAWRLGLAWPLLLLLVHLVERLAHDVVLFPVDGRAADDVLRLRYGREFGCACGRSHVGRVLARLYPRLRASGVPVSARRGAGQRGREDIAVRLRGVRAVLVDRLRKGGGVGDGDGLELGQGLEVALALLALQLQQRDGGAQGYDIGVVALCDGDGRRLLAKGRGRRGSRAGLGFCALDRRELGDGGPGGDG
jgi:hypothetical protein